MTKLLLILKAILPKNKIGAWLLGVIAAGLALALSVSPTEIKEHFCAQPVVEVPKVELPQPEVK
jgi:hypothetical protein